MSESDFDTALIAAAFRLAGEGGWRKVNAVTAARAANLSLPEARARFPSRAAILLRFGRLADQAALQDAATEGPVRDRLFDLLMRRFDVLQAHRSGVKALLRTLPTDPATALLLACATRRSMRWMLQAAGIQATGPQGELQVRGLLAVWLWGVRAWERDPSDDLSQTMAAVDNALGRAERIAQTLCAPPRKPQATGTGQPEPLAPSDDASPPSDDGPSPSGDTPPPADDVPPPSGLAESGPPRDVSDPAAPGVVPPASAPPTASPTDGPA